MMEKHTSFPLLDTEIFIFPFIFEWKFSRCSLQFGADIFELSFYKCNLIKIEGNKDLGVILQRVKMKNDFKFFLESSYIKYVPW